MKQQASKTAKRIRRHAAIRARVSGTLEMPRLAVFRSNKFIYAQIIDDVARTTLAASSDVKGVKGTKTERATAIGREIAGLAAQKGITRVVFDRGGFKYIGRIQALADGARAAGLQF